VKSLEGSRNYIKLNLSKDASEADIKKAYHSQVQD
jgi:DnaJ-class molecular chaperone